jgi:UDP-N-acetylglucosamine 1-carboxyvinyltransferase
MQPQICVLQCLAKGVSILTENVWDNRFRYVEELKCMGANIKVDGKTAVIEGPVQLSAARIKAVDLRAGAAMIIAGLAAKGTTEIENIYSIQRGYEDIEQKLQALGADFKYVNLPDGYERASAE